MQFPLIVQQSHHLFASFVELLENFEVFLYKLTIFPPAGGIVGEAGLSNQSIKMGWDY